MTLAATSTQGHKPRRPDFSAPKVSQSVAYLRIHRQMDRSPNDPLPPCSSGGDYRRRGGDCSEPQDHADGCHEEKRERGTHKHTRAFFFSNAPNSLPRPSFAPSRYFGLTLRWYAPSNSALLPHFRSIASVYWCASERRACQFSPPKPGVPGVWLALTTMNTVKLILLQTL